MVPQRAPITATHQRSGKPTLRKSPPLIGLGYAGSAPVGWDRA
jgi:hypothetical protein